MTSELSLLNRAREEFLSMRTKQEIQVADWGKKLLCIDPAILKDVDLPVEITLKSLMPELYEDNPDQIKYKEQYDAAMDLFQAVNLIADRYNEEAKRCLLEYQGIASR